MIKIQKVISLVLILLSSSLISYSQDSKQDNTVSPAELELLIGNWQGSLTYVDYSSGNPFSMPVEITFEKGKNEFELRLQMAYPNEPKANKSGKLTISKDGKSVDKKTIISRRDISENEIEIITEYTGKDGNENKKAQIRLTYIFSQIHFMNKKEVRFEGESEWLKRNEFNYQRSN